MADDSQSPGTGSLADSLRALEEKLAASDGLEPLVSLLGEVESLLVNVSPDSLSNMRGEIRAVIDRLLAINGELQHVAKLKKLLP
jgi:hypothetical protein